jgi:hypothetical protein
MVVAVQQKAQGDLKDFCDLMWIRLQSEGRAYDAHHRTHGKPGPGNIFVKVTDDGNLPAIESDLFFRFSERRFDRAAVLGFDVTPWKAHLAGMVRKVGRPLSEKDRQLARPINEGYEHRGGYEWLHRLHADVERMVATLVGIIIGDERVLGNNSASSETVLDPRARRCADHDIASDTKRRNDISGAVTNLNWPAAPRVGAQAREDSSALGRIGEP